jgi:hypothetical protein
MLESHPADRSCTNPWRFRTLNHPAVPPDNRRRRVAVLRREPDARADRVHALGYRPFDRFFDDRPRGQDRGGNLAGLAYA